MQCCNQYSWSAHGWISFSAKFPNLVPFMFISCVSSFPNQILVDYYIWLWFCKTAILKSNFFLGGMPPNLDSALYSFLPKLKILDRTLVAARTQSLRTEFCLAGLSAEVHFDLNKLVKVPSQLLAFASQGWVLVLQ